MRLLLNIRSYIGGLLFLAFFLQGWSFTWQEYVRLLVICVGVGYLVWRSWQGYDWIRGLSTVLSLLFIFIIVGFNKKLLIFGQMPWFETACMLLILVFGISWLLIQKERVSNLDWVDRIVLTFGGGILVFQVYSYADNLFYCSFFFLNFISCAVVWIIFRHSFFDKKQVDSFLFFAVGILSVIVLIGIVRIGVLFFLLKKADELEVTSLHDQAAEYYNRGEELSERLNFQKIAHVAAFNRASIFWQQGNTQKAAQVLKLEDDFIKTIDFTEWRGPAGGNLYTEISCWTEVMLYPGRMNICIYAKGTYALGAWPIMRVKFEDILAENVVVSSGDVKPYCFEVETMARKGTLSISFINDGYNSSSEDRNLWIDSAKIIYKDVFWK